jgi:glycyl-tRNA synthetase
MFGIAYRTDFDLKNHSFHSKLNLSYTDNKTGEKFVPHVIEPTFGLSRLVGVVLCDSYQEEEVKGKPRVFLKLAPALAPIKAAIFPLQKDEKLKTVALEIYTKLKSKFTAEFDDAGNIGKMYRRQDEIGTPWCITVDYQSLEDNTVTVRDRDTTKQERIPIAKVDQYIGSKLLII